MPHLRDDSYETSDGTFAGGAGARTCAADERNDETPRRATHDSHDQADAMAHRYSPGRDPSSAGE